MTGSRDRYGEITVLNLKDYGIPMLAQDGKYLIPLKTVSTLFLSPLQCGAYFNGKNMFLIRHLCRQLRDFSANR